MSPETPQYLPEIVSLFKGRAWVFPDVGFNWPKGAVLPPGPSFWRLNEAEVLRLFNLALDSVAGQQLGRWKENDISIVANGPFQILTRSRLARAGLEINFKWPDQLVVNNYNSQASFVVPPNQAISMARPVFGLPMVKSRFILDISHIGVLNEEERKIINIQSLMPPIKPGQVPKLVYNVTWQEKGFFQDLPKSGFSLCLSEPVQVPSDEVWLIKHSVPYFPDGYIHVNSAVLDPESDCPITLEIYSFNEQIPESVSVYRSKYEEVDRQIELPVLTVSPQNQLDI